MQKTTKLRFTKKEKAVLTAAIQGTISLRRAGELLGLGKAAHVKMKFLLSYVLVDLARAGRIDIIELLTKHY